MRPQQSTIEKILPFIGNRYGKIVITKYIGTKKSEGANRTHLRHIVEYVCDCGKKGATDFHNIYKGNTTSCGCGRGKAITHGFTCKTRAKGYIRNQLYNVWAGIKARCHNSNSEAYPNYGGRGIFVDENWLNSFESFYKDVGEHPGKGWSFERIDNNKGYEPGNWKWATRKEQSRNTRANRYIIISGNKYCIKDASKLLGVSGELIRKTFKRGNFTKTDAPTALELQDFTDKKFNTY